MGDEFAKVYHHVAKVLSYSKTIHLGIYKNKSFILT